MRPILTGICIGLSAAIFVSMYAQYLFDLTLPYIVIYGIIAPLISAIATFVLALSDKNERKRNGLDWDDKKKKEE